jgi:hypothetical protein
VYQIFAKCKKKMHVSGGLPHQAVASGAHAAQLSQPSGVIPPDRIAYREQSLALIQHALSISRGRFFISTVCQITYYRYDAAKLLVIL